MKHLLKITSAVLVLLLCALGGVFLWRSGFFAALSSQQALQDYISQFAPYSHLCFFLLQFLSVVLAPIPSNLSAAAGGMLFGTWPSFFLTIAAVLSASLLVFLLARALGQSFADRLVSRAISDKYLSIVRAKTLPRQLILFYLLKVCIHIFHRELYNIPLPVHESHIHAYSLPVPQFSLF